MTGARTVAVLGRTLPKADDDLGHVFCECDPDASLCGLDISDVPFVDVLRNPCVVCGYLELLDCERCGE